MDANFQTDKHEYILDFLLCDRLFLNGKLDFSRKGLCHNMKHYAAVKNNDVALYNTNIEKYPPAS